MSQLPSKSTRITPRINLANLKGVNYSGSNDFYQHNIDGKHDDEPLAISSMLVETKADLLALFRVSKQPVQTEMSSIENKKTEKRRLNLYRYQSERTRQLYQAPETIRPTYLVQSLKVQFVEYQHHVMAENLDKRGIVDSDNIRRLWQQIHIIDDIIRGLIKTMPSHDPVGWKIYSQGCNHLKLGTIGRMSTGDELVADQSSINSYVLGHFGVTSFTYDQSIYIGHVLGYLFCCYYFAHLSIPYGVMALSKESVSGYPYESVTTPELVRLLHRLDGQTKQRIYQLSVICARLSYFATNKRIEKMLIAEVNEFDKNLQQKHLDLLLLQGIMPDLNQKT